MSSYYELDLYYFCKR